MGEDGGGRVLRGRERRADGDEWEEYGADGGGRVLGEGERGQMGMGERGQ